MGRYYKLSKGIQEESAQKILEEIRQMEMVDSAEFDADYAGIVIFADPGAYTDVMDRAVNIFAREGGGAELSFQHFVAE